MFCTFSIGYTLAVEDGTIF